jgi:hypothetical protein
MKLSPLQAAKKRFGIEETNPTLARKAVKEKLVDAVQKLSDDGLWIDRVNADKGLSTVSNRKLLHLLDVLETVKSHGGRAKVIADLASLAGRKDATYASRFEKYSTPRLWDAYRAAKKRAAN